MPARWVIRNQTITLCSIIFAGQNTMNRQQRIEAAQLKVEGLQIIIKPIASALAEAESELRVAKESYDEGERVTVEERCRRGCCVELSYTGAVVGWTDACGWQVKRDNDGRVLNASSYNMKRT